MAQTHFVVKKLYLTNSKAQKTKENNNYRAINITDSLVKAEFKNGKKSFCECVTSFMNGPYIEIKDVFLSSYQRMFPTYRLP